jgi:hypothetical protein
VESYIGYGSFFIGIFCGVLYIAIDDLRNIYDGRAYSIMNIFLALVGAGIWCGIVYMVLLFLGVEL